jgi:hypothetical protein
MESMMSGTPRASMIAFLLIAAAEGGGVMCKRVPHER